MIYTKITVESSNGGNSWKYKLVEQEEFDKNSIRENEIRSNINIWGTLTFEK